MTKEMLFVASAAFIKFSMWFPVDTAAEKPPRKEAALTDGSLSPVPEATSSIHRVSKATQTQPSSPSPALFREKVSSSIYSGKSCLKFVSS